MNVVLRCLAVVAVLLVAATDVFAQATAAKVPNLGAGIGMGLSVVGIGVGVGLIGFSALAGIARQPEQAGAIRGAMILLAGLVEGAGIIALVLCLVLGLV
jgi:F0F1-type ATP synthase membrane subunit c/vacuolar-type H+-ATPase subunit K